MIRLLRVELTRMLSRRAVLVLAVAAVVIPTIIGVATALNSRPPSADAIADAEQQVAAEREQPYVQKELDRCLEKPQRYGLENEEDIEAACEEVVLPQLEWYLYYEQLDLGFESKQGSGVAVVVILGILMLLAGTTFAGHDWASGSITNQLLFESRRIRVWVAKAVAVTAVTGAVSGAVLTAYWLGLGAVARNRDLLTDGLLLDALQSGWRGAGVAAAAALGGYALTMLFRNTVAALGVLLGLGLAGGLLIAALGIDAKLNPGLNLLAVVVDGAKYWAEAPCGDGVDGGCAVEKTLSLRHGLVFLTALLTAAAAASLATFRQRDVG